MIWLCLECSREGGEEWSNSGCNMRVESIGFSSNCLWVEKKKSQG